MEFIYLTFYQLVLAFLLQGTLFYIPLVQYVMYKAHLKCEQTFYCPFELIRLCFGLSICHVTESHSITLQSVLLYPCLLYIISGGQNMLF